MSVKDTARKQYVRTVDSASDQVLNLPPPSGGWLTLLRKALGMSGAQVAERMGISRNAIYQAERNEPGGTITLNQMKKIAAAMGGEFVYAVVPKGHVKDIIQAQAKRKAQARIRRVNSHMALENQSLTGTQTEQRIDELAKQLAHDMPADFWQDK